MTLNPFTLRKRLADAIARLTEQEMHISELRTALASSNTLVNDLGERCFRLQMELQNAKNNP